MTFWTIYGGDKLICPLLSSSRVIILHDFMEIIDYTIVGADIVGRGSCLFLRYLHVLKCAVHHLLHGVVIKVLNRCLDGGIMFL